MATDLLTPGAWRFKGDPFQRFDQYYGPGGLIQGYDPSQGPVYALGGDNPAMVNPERRDAWMASDELLASDPELFGNATNLKVVSQDENGYTVMRKTGDKEGTLIRIEKDPQTGEFVSKGAVGTEAWDTNAHQRFQNMGFGSVLGAALGGYGLDQLGLAGPGVSGFAGPDAFLGVGEIASFGSGSPGAAMFGGAGAAGGAAGSAAGLGGADAVTAAEWFGGPGAATNPSAGLFGSSAAGAAGAGAAGSAAAKAAGSAAAGGASSVLDKVLGGTGTAADWAEILGPLVLGGLSYADAKNSAGPQGWGPAMDKFTGTDGLLSRKLTTPTFGTGFQQPQFQTGLLGPQQAMQGLLNKRYY